MRPARWVVDTNCLVSALVFESRHLAWLRGAWMGGTIRPLASRATTQELLDVLAYPKFALSSEDREELLADWLPFVESVVVPARVPRIPSLRDPDDLKFLALARHARADAVVSGDADLLAVRAQFDITILPPAEARILLSKHTGG